MNGHFSAVGDKPDDSKYEHGVQVIDEDKEFKYVPSVLQHVRRTRLSWLTRARLSPAAAAITSTNTSRLPMSPRPASTTI